MKHEISTSHVTWNRRQYARFLVPPPAGRVYWIWFLDSIEVIVQQVLTLKPDLMASVLMIAIGRTGFGAFVSQVWCVALPSMERHRRNSICRRKV